MTDQSSPITPPDALRTQWRTEAPIYRDFGVGRENWLMDRAAQWGWDQRGTINEAQLQERANQELEACCEWLAIHFAGLEKILRAARRPKPATLNSIALQMLGTIEQSEHFIPEITDTIRRALEALPND
jgi:hypothetical protein